MLKFESAMSKDFQTEASTMLNSAAMRATPTPTPMQKQVSEMFFDTTAKPSSFSHMSSQAMGGYSGESKMMSGNGMQF